MKKNEIQFFDKDQKVSRFEKRNLPHWMQSGTFCFITWRVADSLPQELLEILERDIDTFLAGEGIKNRNSISDNLVNRDSITRFRTQRNLFLIRDRILDHGAGRCPFQESAHASIVLHSLRSFDEVRYFLTDVVVMPNHVHFLAAFANGDSMLKQCTEWKRFIGRKINASEGRSGEFWQVDQFDHLVRDQSAFDYFRQYIENNPRVAGLADGRYLHWKKEWFE